MQADEYRRLADAQLDQYFLVSPEKIAILNEAAGIRESDSIIELGAGVGTVARSFRKCRSLTVVELDGRLSGELRKSVPYATVLVADGVELLRKGAISADVLVANLPSEVTLELIAILPDLRFRTMIAAVGSCSAFDSVSDRIEARYLTVIEGDDFVPPQPVSSYLMRATLRRAALDFGSTGVDRHPGHR